MPYNNHQPTPARRCIALARSGSQCKNTINCSHHRCKDRGCAEEKHTRRDIALTDLSIRQEYLTPACLYTTSTSRSPNGSGQRDTSTVPLSLHRVPNQNNMHCQNSLIPDESSRNSEVNERDDDDHGQVPGPRHAQPSLDVHARGSPVQPPLFKDKDTRIRHEEYDIAGLSRARQSLQRSDQPFQNKVTPLLDPSLDVKTLGSPILDSTLRDPNPEAVVTAKGEEKEARCSNEGDYNSIKSSALMSVAKSSDIIPTLSDPNLEAVVTVRGKEKERRHSEPSPPSPLPSQTPTATSSSQTSTQSSPPNPDQTSNPAPEMIQSNDTARQSLTPFSYDSEHDSEPVEPHPFTTFTGSPFQSAFNSDPDPTVSSPAPEWTQSADTNHGITLAQMEECGQHFTEFVRYESDAVKLEMVERFIAVMWPRD